MKTLDELMQEARTILADVRDICHEAGEVEWLERLVGVKFLWNPRLRSTVGYCKYSTPAVIEFNPRVFSIKENQDRYFDDTVRHELAHAAVGSGNGHNYVWKNAAQTLGAIPSECIQGEVDGAIHRRQKRHLAECSRCKVELPLTAVRANRIRRGQRTYSHRSCGGEIRLK